MRALPLVVVLALLGGCLSSPDEGAAAPESAEVEAAAVGADPETTAVPAAPAFEERTFPFAFEGNTGTWVCAPDGPSSCMGLPAGVESDNTFVPLEYAGNVSAVAATLTWTATTPATETMYVSIFALRSCGEGCLEMSDESYSAFTEGVSPLTLDATGVVLQPEEKLYLHVGVVDPTPQPPVPFFYGTDQAFSLEGAVTALVPVEA